MSESDSQEVKEPDDETDADTKGRGHDTRHDDDGNDRGGDVTSSTDEIGDGGEVNDENTQRGPNKTDSQDTPPTDSTTISPSEVTYTPRFTGYILFFGVLVSIGILTFNPAAIAGAMILLVFLFASIIQTPTNPKPHFTTTYNITPENPRPAERVTIEVTITNTSEENFADIRFIDTVPEGLTVVDGSPRAAKPLQPGDSITISYTVIAQRGTYSFGPVHARTRTLMGSMWVQNQIEDHSHTSLHCAVNADGIPLEERATHYIGGLLGDSGGDGIEFYATREYHRGDSPTKINWRELAKRGELSTISYREQQAAEVTVICDARGWSHVSTDNGTPSSASLSVYAAYQLTSSLINRGHYVGMTVPGIPPVNTDESGRGRDGFPYRRFDHGRGSEQKQRAFQFIEEVEDTITATADNTEKTSPLRDYGTGSFRNGRTSTGVFDVSPYKVDLNEFVDSLTAWTSPTTQFIFITPLLDAGSHRLCMKLKSMGASIVIVSPDPTKTTTNTTTPDTNVDTPSQTATKPESTKIPIRMVNLQRSTRIESLRHNGLTVIDWDPNTPLSVCCERQTLPGV